MSHPPQHPPYGPGHQPANPAPINPAGPNPANRPGPMAPYGPPRPGNGPHWPIRRKPVVMVVPIIAMVLGAVMTVVMTSEGLLSNTPLLVLIPMLVTAAGLLFVWWIDRWEPEPVVMWIGALAWGAGVATSFAMVFNGIIGSLFGESFGAAVGAPLVEETTKGLFLLLVLYFNKKGRAEFNSLTDAVVYGSLIGIGFSYVEDISYMASSESSSQALATAIMRAVTGGFSHSIYTTMTAIGVWYGLSRGGSWKVFGPLLGWLAAVLLHGFHNGSTLFGLGGYVAQMVLLALPALIFVIVTAVRSSKQEGRTLHKQLPSIVHAGWVTGEEATWLSQVKSRRARLKVAPKGTERKRLATIADATTELAFLRERLDTQVARRQVLRPELLEQHDDLVALLEANRNVMGAQLPQQYSPMNPQQGQFYSAQPPMYQ